MSTQSERASSQMQPCTSAQEDGECSVHVSAVDTTVSKLAVSNILIAESWKRGNVWENIGPFCVLLAGLAGLRNCISSNRGRLHYFLIAHIYFLSLFAFIGCEAGVARSSGFLEGNKIIICVWAPSRRRTISLTAVYFFFTLATSLLLTLDLCI